MYPGSLFLARHAPALPVALQLSPRQCLLGARGLRPALFKAWHSLVAGNRRADGQELLDGGLGLPPPQPQARRHQIDPAR